MPCQVKNCAITDDRLLFHCYGSCGKEFHATCAGSRRNHEEHIRSYMLPMCEDCQKEFTSIVELRKLLQKQHALAGDIEAANNKICAFINSFNVSAAFESLESNMNELRTACKASDGAATEIINHVSSVVRESCKTDSLESCMQQVNDDLSAKIISQVEYGITRLEKQLEVIQQDVLHANLDKEFPTTVILEEIRSLSSEISTMQLPETANVNCSQQLTLAEELADELRRSKSMVDDEDNSGWRLLGSKRVWKSNWEAYDLRQLRRRQQEKEAKKSRYRRKHKKINNYNNNINKTFNNINQNKNNKNRRNVTTEHHYNNNYLPSDKELLAAAKDRFSKPPVPDRPPVRFLRGETLNPYPADNEFPSTSQQHDTRNWMLRMSPEYATSTQTCHTCLNFRKF